jgi:hypothetical protein
MLEKNSDFIEVVDQALSPELCQQIIQAFEASGHKSAGKTGGGVDPERKKKASTFLLVNYPSLHHCFSKLCRLPVNIYLNMSKSITLH